MKFKNIIVSIVAALSAVIAFNAVKHLFPSKSSSLDTTLMQASSEINKGLPVMLDKETRLDTTTALPGKSLLYKYTLVNFTAKDVSKDDLITKVKPISVNVYKTSDTMKTFRNKGVTMVYQYYDKNGVFIGDFTVGPGDL
jgi:hypothetical protein